MFRTLLAGPFGLISVLIISTFFGASASFCENIIIKNVPEKKVQSPWSIGVKAATGYGVFQDIQLPTSDASGLRADGTTSVEENKTHVGLPLIASVGFDYRVSRTIFEMSLEYLDMQSTAGPADTQSSSYNRISLVSGLKQLYPVGGYKAVFGAQLIGRRSSYNNVSTGHYIDSVMFQGNLGIEKSSRWMVEGFYSMAPYAQFGYNSGSGREKFSNSTTALSMFGIHSSLNLYKTTWLDLGVDVEKAKISIDSVEDYESYGLSVAPTSQPSRIYNMATMVVRAGFHKTF